jgi:hypothetical protein
MRDTSLAPAAAPVFLFASTLMQSKLGHKYPALFVQLI